MRDFIQTWQTNWSKKLSTYVPLLVVIVVFGGLGTAMLLNSHAATPTASLETENGTVSGNACATADTGASSGQAVKFGTSCGTTTASSVSQWGVTWTFDKAYPVGHFVNGDWWVVGPVKITSITPDFTGTRNGWEANPGSGLAQGMDSRLDYWTPSRVPSLPYTAAAGTSIIKGVSRSDGCGLDANHHACLDTAAVLTVLGSVPADNGATTFRPPFFGSFKPMFTTAQLQTNLLPSLAPVAGAPTLGQVTRRYQRVQIDYMNDWPGRYIHASANYVNKDPYTDDDVSEYGSEIAHDSDEAVLRLMLNDSVSAKTPALINVVQAGIDMYGMHKGGVDWSSNGGHMEGRKLLAVFAAVMLNDATMKSEISNAAYGTYGDDGEFYYSTNQKTVSAMAALGFGPALYGQDANCPAGMYEQNQANDTGTRDCRDPIGMIDGGHTPGGEYDFCCTAQPTKGMALAARLLPGGKAVWNYQPLFDYADRWVKFGAWTTPDDWNALGKTPARNYASLQGSGKDDGYYDSQFVNNMWTAYRGTSP